MTRQTKELHTTIVQSFAYPPQRDNVSIGPGRQWFQFPQLQCGGGFAYAARP